MIYNIPALFLSPNAYWVIPQPAFTAPRDAGQKTQLP